jgi:hypothetical protein
VIFIQNLFRINDMMATAEWRELRYRGAGDDAGAFSRARNSASPPAIHDKRTCRKSICNLLFIDNLDLEMSK